MSSRIYSEIQIGPLEASHWEGVRAIYLDGIATGQATFETAAPSWDEWDLNHLPFARVVAISQTDAPKIVGWAALNRVSSRPVYRGVAEVSVYVASCARGQGVGKMLLETLIAESEVNGCWTLQASVFPENTASLALHKGCGFRIVGVRERIAQRNGVWRNTVLLERRSSQTGSDN